MIIRSESDVTEAVLGEMHRTPNARTKELLASLVKHLHAFVQGNPADRARVPGGDRVS